MFEVFKYGFTHWWNDFNDVMIKGGWVIGMFILPILFVVYVACIVFGINILINKKIREKGLFNTKIKRIFLSVLLFSSPIISWFGFSIYSGKQYCDRYKKNEKIVSEFLKSTPQIDNFTKTNDIITVNSHNYKKFSTDQVDNVYYSFINNTENAEFCGIFVEENDSKYTYDYDYGQYNIYYIYKLSTNLRYTMYFMTEPIETYDLNEDINKYLTTYHFSLGDNYVDEQYYIDTEDTYGICPCITDNSLEKEYQYDNITLTEIDCSGTMYKTNIIRQSDNEVIKDYNMHNNYRCLLDTTTPIGAINDDLVIYMYQKEQDTLNDFSMYWICDKDNISIGATYMDNNAFDDILINGVEYTEETPSNTSINTEVQHTLDDALTSDMYEDNMADKITINNITFYEISFRGDAINESIVRHFDCREDWITTRTKKTTDTFGVSMYNDVFATVKNQDDEEISLHKIIYEKEDEELKAFFNNYIVLQSETVAENGRHIYFICEDYYKEH